MTQLFKSRKEPKLSPSEEVTSSSPPRATIPSQTPRGRSRSTHSNPRHYRRPQPTAKVQYTL
ncbi:hypothetical protein BJX62DRAFT_86210 [Aspergillus germanicus]